MIRSLYTANDNALTPCHGVPFEERIYAAGEGEIVDCCPVCEAVYFVLTDAGWIRVDPADYA